MPGVDSRYDKCQWQSSKTIIGHDENGDHRYSQGATTTQKLSLLRGKRGDLGDGSPSAGSRGRAPPVRGLGDAEAEAFLLNI